MNKLSLKLLLNQISGSSFQSGINTLLKYYDKMISSIFNRLNSNFRNALRYIRDSNLVNRPQFNRNKSKRFENELVGALTSEFYGHVYFSEKYTHFYSFFDEKDLLKGEYIPYIRVGFFENTRFLLRVIKEGFFDPNHLVNFDDFRELFDEILDKVIHHDDFDASLAYINEEEYEEFNYEDFHEEDEEEDEEEEYENYNKTELPLFTPILYLKIRPFVINDKKIIVIEEIQSTIVFEINENYNHVLEMDYYKGFSKDLSELFESNALRYLKWVFEFLYDECDALYIVRRAIPKNQRFLYDPLERFRCGNPMTNEKFVRLVSLVHNPKRIIINPDGNYQYLYCLKELKDENLFKQFNLNLLNSIILKYKFVDEKEIFPNSNDVETLNSLFLEESKILKIDLSKYNKPYFKFYYKVVNVKKDVITIRGLVGFYNIIDIKKYNIDNKLKNMRNISQKYKEHKQIFNKKFKKISKQIISSLSQEKSVLGVPIKPKIILRDSLIDIIADYSIEFGFTHEFELKIPIKDIFRKAGIIL